jgi:hypothetical protein
MYKSPIINYSDTLRTISLRKSELDNAEIAFHRDAASIKSPYMRITEDSDDVLEMWFADSATYLVVFSMYSDGTEN